MSDDSFVKACVVAKKFGISRQYVVSRGLETDSRTNFPKCFNLNPLSDKPVYVFLKQEVDAYFEKVKQSHGLETSYEIRNHYEKT